MTITKRLSKGSALTHLEMDGNFDELLNLSTSLASSSGSASVGFLQAGSGAASRTVQAKMRDWVSLTDFGASTSASASTNTTAFNAALAAHECVFVPGNPGDVYDLNALSELTTGRVIYGNGATLRFNTTGDCIPFNGTSEVQRERVLIKGLSFDNVTNTPASFIKIRQFVNAVIEDCKFADCAATYCIDNYKGYGTQVRNCVFSDVTGGGIQMRHTADTSTYSYIFGVDNCDFTRLSGIGINYQGGHVLKISKCVIESCTGDGIRTSSNGVDVSTEIFIDSCYFESNTAFDINLDCDAGGTYYGVATIIGCYFNATPTLSLDTRSKVTFIGINGQGGAPLVVSGSADAECYLIGCAASNFTKSGTFKWQDFGDSSNNIVSYTPTWSSSGGSNTLGDGSVSGYYTRTGNMVSGSLKFTFGSTSSVTAGVQRWALPFTSADNGLVTWSVGNLQDSGTANYFVRASIAANTNYVQLAYLDASAAPQNVTQAAPMTWAAGDSVEVSFNYIAKPGG